MAEYKSEFSIGGRVFIDGCSSLEAIILSVTFNNDDSCFYHLQWFNDGDVFSMDFDEWRLTVVGKE